MTEVRFKYPAATRAEHAAFYTSIIIIIIMIMRVRLMAPCVSVTYIKKTPPLPASSPETASRGRCCTLVKSIVSFFFYLLKTQNGVVT